MNSFTCRLVIGLVLASVPATALAQGRQGTPLELLGMSLKELMSLEITTAGRREQPVEEVAAAVHVITQDDIRRSGIRTLPELFRLVPGVQVARVNSNNWAISMRGFNEPYSNKLLVLVDGRSIYNRSFSGVFWSTEDLLVDDIDRIEVIRGSGGSVWGANAVNGVINIVTRSAADTQGLLVRLGQESFDGAQVAVRYGGSAGKARYRLFSQWTDHRSSSLGRDGSAGDEWGGVTSGFRTDWENGNTEVLVTGSFNASTTNALWMFPLGPGGRLTTDQSASDRYTGSLLGRWTRSFADGSAFQVQSFFNYRDFNDPIVEAHERATDIDVDYHRRVGSRHELVVGGGLREIRERYIGTFAVSFIPAEAGNRVINAFVQDEVRIGQNVRVTVGTKFERDSFAGWGIQPTARVAWDIVPSRHLLWGSVSRALRTPSSMDVGVFVNVDSLPGPGGMPMAVQVSGNRDFAVEELISEEIGYRAFVLSSLSFDATVFHGRYDGLKTTELGEPRLELTPFPHLVLPGRFENRLEATTRGLELSAHWMPVKSWRVDGSYSAFQLEPRLDPTSSDPNAAAFDGNAPNHQWQVHSTLWLGPRVEAQTSLFYTGRLEELGVAAYARADARIEFALSDRLSLIGTGHNLLDSTHQESSADTIGMKATLIPRSGGLQFAWRF